MLLEKKIKFLKWIENYKQNRVSNPKPLFEEISMQRIRLLYLPLQQAEQIASSPSAFNPVK